MTKDSTRETKTLLAWTLLAVVATTAVLLGACGGAADGRARAESTAPSTSQAAAPPTLPAGPVMACDRREREDASESVCIDYVGKANTKSFVEGECSAVAGKLLDACPAEGVIGRCVRWAGTRNETVEVYYPGGEKVFQICEATGGTKG